MIRLAVRCRSGEAEAVLASLLELAPGGVEERTDPDGELGVTEYAIYGAAGELPDLGSVQAAAGDALVDVRTSTVPADWGERWKRFYAPLLLAGRLYVRPPWERPAERGGVVEVVIDPGRAFGTGGHPTTRMCLELLLGEAGGAGTLGPVARLRALFGRAGRRSVCDVGCGSGVLAITAAKLGFAPVVGLDAEAAALEESARNARLNGVELELRSLDVREEPVPPCAIVTANLTTPLLERMAERWKETDRPSSVIASGFLADEGDRIGAAFAGVGLAERRRLRDGEWGALLAARRGA